MGRENAQWAAVRAVEDYFESSPVVVRLLSSDDGMLRDDGELDLFLPEGEGYDGFFGKVPVEVEWSKNANVHPYKIANQGCASYLLRCINSGRYR